MGKVVTLALFALLSVTVACSEQPIAGPSVSSVAQSSVGSETSDDSNSVGDATTTSTIASGSSESATTTAAPTTAAEGLVWTVVAVAGDDVLNVRTEPDPSSEIIHTLAPWSTSVSIAQGRDGPLTGTSGNGRWNYVVSAEGDEGWVNSRFVVAQPVELSDEDRQLMVERAESFLRWVTDGDGGRSEALGRRGLWIGGVGIFADGPTPWTWIPADELETSADWRTVRTFETGFNDIFDCSECDKSVLDFLALERLDDTTRTLVDDVAVESARGLLDGLLWRAPESLHRIVFDKPSSTWTDDDGTEQPYLDWQRIHVVFDWSSGEPKIAMINTHGWTP